MKKDWAAAIFGRTLFPRAEDIPQSLAMAFMRMMMAAEVRPSEVHVAEARPAELRPDEFCPLRSAMGSFAMIRSAPPRSAR